MKEPFDEGRTPAHPDPLDTRTAEFDWAAISDLLREADGEPPTQPDMALLSEVLTRLFTWLTAEARVNPREFDRLIGRRALAMVWAIRPDLIRGTPSLARLARRIGQTKAGLSWHAAAFSREFGIRNRSQAAGWKTDPQEDHA